MTERSPWERWGRSRRRGCTRSRSPDPCRLLRLLYILPPYCLIALNHTLPGMSCCRCLNGFPNDNGLHGNTSHRDGAPSVPLPNRGNPEDEAPSVRLSRCDGRHSSSSSLAARRIRSPGLAVAAPAHSTGWEGRPGHRPAVVAHSLEEAERNKQALALRRSLRARALMQRTLELGLGA